MKERVRVLENFVEHLSGKNCMLECELERLKKRVEELEFIIKRLQHEEK